MKLQYLLTLFLTLPAFVSAETIYVEDLVERNGLYYKKFTNVPFTGKTSGLDQGTFKDGKLHGPSEEYHESGQLRFKGNYKDGKLHGSGEWYHENGKLRFIGNYKDGKKHGREEWYKENGQLWRKGTHKDDSAHGLFELYRENGKLKAKENYKDGKRISRTCFTESGEVRVCGP